MAYVTSNPPAKLVDTVGGTAALWIYKSADDDATVNGAGYFTNGKSLGMEVGDPVIVVDTTTPKTSYHYVSAVNSTTGAVTTAFGAVA